MEYKFSTIVDPSSYDTRGLLCDGYDVRYHKNWELEDIGCLRCQEQWRQFVGPLGAFKGALGNPMNLISLAIPECLPERLSVVSFANELAFMHDDVTDIAEHGDIHNDDFKDAFNKMASTGTMDNSASGKRALQAYIAKEMVRIDKDRAIPTIKAWAKFVDYGGRQETTRFASEKEYIDYRIEDIGLWYWYGLLSFAMALNIPEHEREMCHQICETAYIQILMVHDLASWEKEKLNAAALGKETITNIIFVLMDEHGISESEAKERCRQTARKLATDYLKIVADYKTREDISLDSRKYIESWLYTISGNAVWSWICPRYNRSASFTDRQLELMRSGVPKDHASGIPNGSTNGAINGSTGGTNHGTANGNGHANGNGNGHVMNGSPPRIEVEAQGELLSAVTVAHLKSRKSFKIGDHDGEVESLNAHGQALDSKVLQAPYEYITALPSKGLREQAIDALNVWFRVPTAKLEIIKLITTVLHNASLMLDDVEDCSDLRRGKPATHKIFGLGQTVNSANYQLVRALQELQKLGDPRSLVVLTEELHNLYVGQAMDLHWTSNLVCPSVHEYFQMIEHKTGGLFRLFCRLMAVHSTNPVEADLTEFTNRLGRYFQARDDYQNLVSAEYTKQKGFCEDFEEGKFSLPIIHLMQTMSDNLVLQNIWTQRRINGTATHGEKETILNLMHQSGTLKFTLDSLNVLYSDVEKSVADLEAKFGMENFQLRLIMELLKV